MEGACSDPQAAIERGLQVEDKYDALCEQHRVALIEEMMPCGYTDFSMHPDGDVDRRTNLYFAQTDDMGETWRTAEGEIIETPMTDPAVPGLVHDYRADNRLVYLKDIGFDSEGNPVILYITSSHHQPGPGGDPRWWTIAHWKGSRWVFHEVTQSTHNYDMGSLYIEAVDRWRMIAPTEPGPQRHGTGGEIAMWISDNRGQT